MDFGAVLGGGGSLAGHIAFVDDGAVKYIFAEGEEEVGGGVGCEAPGFEGGEGVGCHGRSLDERVRLGLE